MTTLTPDLRAAVERLRDLGEDPDRIRARLAAVGLITDPDHDLRERIRTGGPMVLGEELLPDVVTAARSPLHEWLNAWHLREAGRPPGDRCAVAAPRGHGKTTAGVELAALWHAATCTRRFVVIISDTDDQAVARVAAIRAIVESSDDVRRVFPRLRPAVPGPWAQDEDDTSGVWRERDLVFACGCRISARGAGVSMRGMKHRERRPDLLLLDDLEDETSVSTPYQIAKRLKWLQRVALGLAGPLTGMSVMWVGTILSRAALLNLATGAALEEGQARPAWARTWTARVFRAEVDGSPREEVTVDVEDPDTGAVFTFTAKVGEPMWAALTREDLAKARGALGDESYAAEYQADPVPEGEGGLIARPVPTSYVNPDAPPLQRLIRVPERDGHPARVVPAGELVRAAALDPQFADEGAADPDLACVAVVGQWGAYTFLLDAWIGRDRHGQAARLVELATKWGCFAAGVEKNGAQVLVADEARQLAGVPVMAETSTEGKAVRALSLSVRSQQGRVFLLPGGEHLAELPDYLVRFPHGRYDDPVDAVVMATNVATRAAPAATGAVPMMGGAR